MLEWAVFSGLVDTDAEVQGRRQRTLLKQRVAHVHPPGDSVPSIRLPRHVRVCRS